MTTTSTNLIDENTILDLPKKIEQERFDDGVLLTAPKCGNFIGLFNDKQETIFKSLQSHSIAQAGQLADNDDDFNFVVAQILDREFFNTPLKMLDIYDTALIYLTNACNLSCPHCYMNSGKANADELTKNEWLEVLTNLQKYGVREAIFSGGEIMLNKDCLDIIKFAKSLGLIVRLKSNGTLWDRDSIAEIANFIDDIQISIDGINEEMNAKVRGKGNFAKALSCVEEFLNNKAKVIIACTPTYENIKEIEAGFVGFAKDLLEKYPQNLSFIVSQKMLGGRGVQIKFDEAQKSYAKITDSIMDRIYPNYNLKNLAISIEGKERIRNCGYGNLAIASNGKIYLCNRIDELSPFADTKQNLGEVLKLAMEFNKRSSVDFTNPCKDCSVRYICGGGCRIDEYKFKGRQDLLKQELQKECSNDFRKRFKQNLFNGLKYIYAV